MSVNVFKRLARRQSTLTGRTFGINSATPQLQLLPFQDDPAGLRPRVIGINEVELLSDLVILVMGATGGGKSTIINLIAGDGEPTEIIPVNSDLEPGSNFTVVRISTSQGNVCFIEVPETKDTQFPVLYQRYNVIGIIFVHKVIDTRIAGELLHDLEEIKRACLNDPYLASRIVCVTTHWSSVKCDDLQELEVEKSLKESEDGWGREVRDESLEVRRFPLGEPTAVRGILSHLLEREKREPLSVIFKECDEAEVWTAHNWKVVVIMGMTGSGKSNFIEKACNIPHQVTNPGSLESTTKNVKAYKVHINGHRLILVDTPGFNDSNRSDYEILKTIANWLETTFRHKILLDGVLYFHRITDNRMSGSALANIKVFRGLTGKGLVFQNVKFVTTMWDHVNTEKGESHENELKTEYWGQMVKDGASVMRFKNTHQSAKEVLKSFRTEWHKQQALQLQVELVTQHQKLKETKAGQIMYLKLDDLLTGYNAHLEKKRLDPNYPMATDPEYTKLIESLKDVERDMKELHIGFRERLNAFLRKLY